MDEVDLSEGEVYLILFRVEYDLRIERLTALQWSLLKAVEDNVPLRQLPIILREIEPDRIFAELLRLIQKGTITKFFN